MAFRIEHYDKPENYVDFEVVNANEKVETFTIPKMDCLPPATLKKINNFVEGLPEGFSDAVHVDRETLKIIAPNHKRLFDGLVARQVNQIMTHWQDESGVKMGESSPSSEASSS